MTESDPEGGTGGAEQSGELTPKRAYELNEGGMSFREIGSLYDVSHTTARRRKEEHEESMEMGKSQVSPNDFEPSDLRSALQDKETENPYVHDCPACGDPIEEGTRHCPHCGSGPIKWE